MADETVDETEAVEAPVEDEAKAEEKVPAKPVAKKAVAKETAEAEASRINRRKVREGIAVANGMDKTAVISVVERVRHPRYSKTLQRTKRLYAHDEENTVGVGDRVRVQETRPLSKLKRWRVIEIVERAR
jgi:small subunit ribosomal protein S17